MTVTQPNTQAWILANTALLARGLTPLNSAAQYTSGIHTLSTYVQSNNQCDKYQQVVVTWLDILHRAMGATMNKRFMWRDWQFVTSGPIPPVPVYIIRNTIIEGFRANSIFNVTYGSGPGNRLAVISKQQFLEMYARPDIVPIGTPLWIVPETDDGSGNTTVRLVPTPDQAYTIQGTSRLLVQPITSGNDQIVFPYYYEHALVTKTMQVLEGILDEGREQSMLALADQFLQEVLRDSGGADEEKDQIDFGFSLWQRWRSEGNRDYNPATDVAGSYP